MSRCPSSGRPVTALPRSTTPVPAGMALPDLVDELFMSFLAAAERQPDDVGALLLAGQLFRGGTVASFLCHQPSAEACNPRAARVQSAPCGRQRSSAQAYSAAGRRGPLKARGWNVSLLDAARARELARQLGRRDADQPLGYGGLAVYAQWARESIATGWASRNMVGADAVRPDRRPFVGRDGGGWRTRPQHSRAERPSERMDPGRSACRPEFDFAGPGTGTPCSSRTPVCSTPGAACRPSWVHSSVTASATRDGRVDADRAIEDAMTRPWSLPAGPWLPSMLPDLVGDAIIPTRQEVFFFGTPAGDDRFGPDQMPAWVAFDEGIYGLPDLEHRGVKVAFDAHGALADPETHGPPRRRGVDCADARGAAAPSPGTRRRAAGRDRASASTRTRRTVTCCSINCPATSASGSRAAAPATASNTARRSAATWRT